MVKFQSLFVSLIKLLFPSKLDDANCELILVQDKSAGHQVLTISIPWTFIRSPIPLGNLEEAVGLTQGETEALGNTVKRKWQPKRSFKNSIG